MPTETWAQRLATTPVRSWPEALLAVLTAAVFLGCLGSVELWGKREQRASAEAIDTVDHGHWLVAQIQGRPRLEKPPLPRWSIAALMVMTGRRDEWVVRLPGALAGMATVALVYLLGRRMGGRSVGLASAFVLCSTGFFVGEMRQASNDGLLALFTTLALHAAFQCFHGIEIDDDSPPTRTARTRGDRSWAILFHTALGLGFLTKGPVILLLVGMTIVPYLALGRRLTVGLRVLFDGRGLLIFMALVFCWPAAVLRDDPVRAACLVAGNVGEDGPFPDSRAPLAFAPGGRVARHDAAVDAHRRGRDLSPCENGALPLGHRVEYHTPLFDHCRDENRPDLVRLVVVAGKPRGVFLMDGGQAKLLHSVLAGNGPSDRHGLGSPCADWPWHE